MLYEKSMTLEDRCELPLNGPSNYRVVDDVVYTRAIEINAVRHCNLSCRSCSHSSPIASPCYYDCKQLEEDLSLVSKVLKSEFIRLVGGEPLLHNDLLNLLKVLKNSGISEKICLVTNGLLLDRLTDEMLQYIDKIEISVYPFNDTVLERIKDNAAKLIRKGVKVRLLEYNGFRESITQKESSNEDLAQVIYDTCQIAHNWRCITVDQGRLYRCPQSMINCEKISDYAESLTISDNLSVNDLLLFLENNNHLKSCLSCLGSVGKKISHTQVKKDEWSSLLPTDIEDGIDKEYVKELSKTLNYKSDCLTRVNLN